MTPRASFPEIVKFPVVVGKRRFCLLLLPVRIPPWAWIPVSCESCVLSRRGLCDGLITRPEELYRLWCVWVWLWTLDNQKALAHWGAVVPFKKIFLKHNLFSQGKSRFMSSLRCVCVFVCVRVWISYSPISTFKLFEKFYMQLCINVMPFGEKKTCIFKLLQSKITEIWQYRFVTREV